MPATLVDADAEPHRETAPGDHKQQRAGVGAAELDGAQAQHAQHREPKAQGEHGGGGEFTAGGFAQRDSEDFHGLTR